MNYEAWEKGGPEEIRQDSLWKSEAYKLSLFTFDIGWYNITILSKDKRKTGIKENSPDSYCFDYMIEDVPLP